MTDVRKQRLTEIDSLRGIAAIAVVLFHYTTRFDELYGHVSTPVAAIRWGHLGVNLFFMISGFVIFMTLERTSNATDFLVSRFSRLYPAYWAAVLMTFIITNFLGLPGKQVDFSTALANMSMVHSLFSIKNVDGVYWTLEVELLFYVMALLAFQFRLIPKLHLLIAMMLLARAIYFLSASILHVDLPWIIYRLLILKFIPWFAAGIMIYRIASNYGTPRRDFMILSACALVLALVDGIGNCVLMLLMSLALYGATVGKIIILRNTILIGLGTISYTLYLIHENIGWAIILKLENGGINSNAAIAVALTISIGLATLLTACVERPALKWIRDKYRHRKEASTRQDQVLK